MCVWLSVAVIDRASVASVASVASKKKEFGSAGRRRASGMRKRPDPSIFADRVVAMTTPTPQHTSVVVVVVVVVENKTKKKQKQTRLRLFFFFHASVEGGDCGSTGTDGATDKSAGRRQLRRPAPLHTGHDRASRQGDQKVPPKKKKPHDLALKETPP